MEPAPAKQPKKRKRKKKKETDGGYVSGAYDKTLNVGRHSRRLGGVLPASVNGEVSAYYFVSWTEGGHTEAHMQSERPHKADVVNVTTKPW